MSNGRAIICDKQITMPAIGTQGTNGVLNGRGISGFDFLKIIMLKQTITKASNVPIETSSPNKPIGKTPAIRAENKPVMIVGTYGVLNFG